MIKAGQQVTIELKQLDQYEKYTSKIMDIKDQSFLMEYPVHPETNKSIFIRNGETLRLSFVNDQKEIYEFLSMVIGRVKNPIPLLQLTLPPREEFRKIQRREFVRVHRAVDVSVHSIHKEFQPFQTVTEDISAGGASLLVPKSIDINIGQKIIVWFVLPRLNGEYHYLKLSSKVIRTGDWNEKRNVISVQFLDKTIQEEQQLLQFCYESQVIKKQKETGIL
ncbi:flagellar brake protein [Fervidibacillus halotolerans]|uniref:Flagellar brake domain-containing protein n=1 Tax=Fervidibacillus halotolerans TaxID=2980027 RepID=A0A9E8M2C6_9BACI|nr:flagellar brake domain-containing protein [Fervidibacillus halotolerans]WAA13777.1 flagellar brake domain-containing protein [Fervidibacillus halotolerans]